MTNGNATGMGVADVITMKFFKKIDIGATYANIITSTYLEGAVIPLIMNTSKDAIALVIKSVPRVKPLDTRVIWIKNTLELTDIAVSDALLAEIRGHSRFAGLGDPGIIGLVGLGFASQREDDEHCGEDHRGS